ncbi:MAG: LysE family transporter [Anderseniella sp.]|nr:LysE family transporter [Anderseniella sp.]
MDYLAPLAILAITQLLAAISPGQSFVLISKLALSSNRSVALSAAMGLGLGTIIWSSAAILGVALLLKSAAWAYTAFKIAGGLYLLWLAVMLWRHAPEPIEIGNAGRQLVSPARGFALGTVTQLANPKVVVFFGSIFVALLPAHAPAWVYVTAVIIVFLNEIGWYSAVALVFSSARPRAAYMRAKVWIDRVMAGFLALIGARLIYDAMETR